MTQEQAFLTAANVLSLAFFVIFFIFRVRKVFHRRSTYNAWLLPFAYFSIGSWLAWILQHLILVTDPLVALPTDILQSLNLWLSIIQNALWVSAILSLHSKHFSNVSLTLPLLVMFAIVIALIITYQTTVLTSEPLFIIGAVTCAAIFTVLALSIWQLPLSKILAVAFFIHGYLQWLWHYLGLTSSTQPQLIQIASTAWHFALLYAWISLTTEMLSTFRVMISSTVLDLTPEREAVEEALRTLNLEGFRAETFGSLPDTPESICASRAEQCHLFILIIGERYGHIIRSRHSSVVEFEYEIARAQNPLKILVYIKNGVTREPQLETFVERLMDFREGHKTSSFTIPQDLYESILRDVKAWLNEQRVKLTTEHWT